MEFEEILILATMLSVVGSSFHFSRRKTMVNPYWKLCWI